MRFSFGRRFSKSKKEDAKSKPLEDGLEHARRAFEQRCSVQNGSATLDALRNAEFGRLKRSNCTYVDYMGAGLYPESLISEHSAILQKGCFGNTHSDSPTASLSDSHIRDARAAVLNFLDASPEDYVCVFTQNATAALKLVGEAFPFKPESCYVLPSDCHNSVNGIRRFAEDAGAEVVYLDALPQGGFDEPTLKDVLSKRQVTQTDNHSLLAITGQSNVTGYRPNLYSVLPFAKSQGFCTLVDAAALASTCRISLRSLGGSVDAMAISFYKMFGYPTGVGALVARKDFLSKLVKPYFSGGTVELVQAPGRFVKESSLQYERFEEGTLNYTALPAITLGIRFLDKHLDRLPARLGDLHHYLHTTLSELRHSNGQPLVRIYTPSPKKPIVSPIGQLPTPPSTPGPVSVKSNAELLDALSESNFDRQTHGYLIACTFHARDGSLLPLTFISSHAAQAAISLRTGCVCNPGGTAAMLDRKESMENIEQCGAIPEIFREEVGVVRLSLGLASNFEDCWKVGQWALALCEDGAAEREVAAWRVRLTKSATTH